MSRENKIWLFSALLLAGLVAYVLYQPSQRVSSVELASVPEYRGPLDDCLQNSYLYARKQRLEAECSLNYVHFYPAPGSYPAAGPGHVRGELKIGSFNVFHLGDNQAPMKNLSLVAKIMDQWDVVGAQELMPLPSEWATKNQQLYSLIVGPQNNLLKFPYDDWKVVEPGYLALLNELRQLDPSWALILQPNPEGEGSTGEMAGFYYRSSLVKLLELKSCPSDRSMDIKTQKPVRNLACLVQVPPEQRRLMSRVGFMARFQSDNFDFIGITTHVRFRAADLPEDLSAQQKEVCSQHTEPSTCKIPKDNVGRFYEVKAIADQIQAVESVNSDQDIIFMGDCNLELSAKTAPLWSAALKAAPGYQALQAAPTTLSVKAGKLASNYDHFILNERAARECDTRSAVSFDFTQGDINAQDEIMREIGKSITNEAIQASLAKRKAQVDRLVTIEKAKGGMNVRAMNDREKSEFINDYERATQRMTANKLGALLELVSDHIPIQITCRTDLGDDD